MLENLNIQERKCYWRHPFLLFVLLLGCATFATEFTGQVVGVIDGNTLKFKHNGTEDQIRLYGIESPELNQKFGQEARQANTDWAMGRVVTVKAWGLDNVGRVIGIVILPDGNNLNHQLVKQGFARWDRRFPQETELEELETQARDAKRGMWGDR